MQGFVEIRRRLVVWLALMTGTAAYFIIANLFCSFGSCGTEALVIINTTGLTVIIAAGGWTAFALIRADTWLLLTPLVAYAAATALFYGFGPMSTFLADDATLLFLAGSVYSITHEDVLHTSLLSSIGIAVSIVGILALLPRRGMERTPRRSVISIKTVALLFVSTGLALKHLVILPSVYGLSDLFIPGALNNLQYLPDLGFALVAMVAARGNRAWKIMFWLIWPWHLLLVFPEFSKKSVMLTILLPAIGAYIGHGSWKRFSLWALAAVLTFSLLQNANTVGRGAVIEADAYSEPVGVGERLAILVETTFGEVDINYYLPAAKIGVQTWWLRLNYAGAQSEAMALYDNGNSSTFTQNILIYFIPRLLWPEKPTIISPGREFHASVTGNANTNTKVGVTVFADGYWQMGWVGLVIFSGAMGGIMGLVTRMMIGQLRRDRLLYLPAAMIGLQMGAIGSTQFLQNSFIAGLPVYFAYCILVWLVYAVLRGRSNPVHALSGLQVAPARDEGRARL